MSAAGSSMDSGGDDEPGRIAEAWSMRLAIYRTWFCFKEYFTARWWTSILHSHDFVPNLYLVIWFVLNVVITLASKALFASLNFPHPMILTAIHLFCTWVMAQTICSTGLHKMTPVTTGQMKGLVVFSVVFTLNIWLSNYSLMAVSVAIHQVFRTTIPLFTMLLSLLLYQERYPKRMIPSVLCVIIGVAATVRGGISTTLFGLIVVACGCLFSSLKGLMSQKAQIGTAGLDTFDLLRVVCPMSVLQLLFLSLLSGELQSMILNVVFDVPTTFTLLYQGILAAALNYVSFKCAALKNPLTMNIAGNVKQVVTPVIAIWLFNGRMTLMLGAGLLVTFIGALWYGREARLRSRSLEHRGIVLELPRTPEINEGKDEKEEMETPSTRPDAATLAV